LTGKQAFNKKPTPALPYQGGRKELSPWQGREKKKIVFPLIRGIKGVLYPLNKNPPRPSLIREGVIMSFPPDKGE
tara:strand:- start:14 stop:238 length:225 start_codon:yes stop_codon:yes gene_type:complete